MAPFYGWGSTTSRLEPLRGGSLLFTTKVYFKYTSEFKNKKYIIWEIYFKYTSEFAHKICFKYTSKFKDKYISLESLLQAYFFSLKMNTILKVNFKYTSLLEKKYIYF